MIQLWCCMSAGFGKKEDNMSIVQVQFRNDHKDRRRRIFWSKDIFTNSPWPIFNKQLSCSTPWRRRRKTRFQSTGNAFSLSLSLNKETDSVVSICSFWLLHFFFLCAAVSSFSLWQMQPQWARGSSHKMSHLQFPADPYLLFRPLSGSLDLQPLQWSSDALPSSWLLKKWHH